jgi:hypothetical protein
MSVVTDEENGERWNKNKERHYKDAHVSKAPRPIWMRRKI